MRPRRGPMTGSPRPPATPAGCGPLGADQACPARASRAGLTLDSPARYTRPRSARLHPSMRSRVSRAPSRERPPAAQPRSTPRTVPTRGVEHPDGCQCAPVDHPAGRHHRRAVRDLPGPRRPVEGYRDQGDAGRRRDDLRGRGRLHPAPVHDDRRPRRRRSRRHRRRHQLLRDREGRGHEDLRARSRLADGPGVPRRGRLLDGLGHHRHVHQREVERAHGGRRPAQPRRGGPGRDARRRRFGLPRRRPVAPRRLRHLQPVRRARRRPGHARRAVPHRRLRLRRLVRGPVRPARRRDLHQGRRRRLRPRRQGREGDPGGRSAQRGRHRGPRR